LAKRKLSRKWNTNLLVPVGLILLIFATGFLFVMHNFYYSGVSQTLEFRLQTIYNTISLNSSSAEESDRVIRQLIEGFEYKEQMELMALDEGGKTLLSSSGFQSEKTIPLSDVAALKEDSSLTFAEYVGRLPSGNEQVASLLVRTPGTPGQYKYLRIITSVRRIDLQILTLMLLFTGVALALFLVVGLFSRYYINSLVRPLSEVGEAARKIAAGDFSIRLPNTHREDEIGELCNVINYMAEELHSSEQLKNDFISSVSHELRTPLTAIKGWGETLMTAGPDDRELTDKALNVIVGETGRLSDMVEELLDFSRMQSGRMKLIKEKMDLLAELDEAVLIFAERARRDGIDIQYNEPENLPFVLGDKSRLRQVFINIIDNALKYSSAGGTLTVEATVSYGLIYIVFADTGCGISEYDLPRVKKKFYKANATRRGSGIGLAVADEIISLHGGTLEIESEQDVGTTVTITLPPITQREESVVEITSLAPPNGDQ